MSILHAQRAPKTSLEACAKKIFSQSDEDGITLEIVKRIGLSASSCIEIGSGNGLENNTLVLLATGWNAIWIDGVHVDNAKLNNYKLSDFASFSGSVILKNARTKKHPQPFQYWFNTNKYYKDNNMDKWLSRYGGDSIVMFSSKMKDKKLIKNEKMIIVIDAGHGGKDPGAKIDEELESKIVESIAKKIKALNGSEDLKIILLREDDSFVSLSDRVNKINQIRICECNLSSMKSFGLVLALFFFSFGVFCFLRKRRCS